MPKLKNLINYCIRDREGNIVLGQPANLPIIVGVIAAVATLVARGAIQAFIALIAFGALFTWAWLEIFDGTTPLRRIIGGAAMIALLIVAFMLMRPFA